MHPFHALLYPLLRQLQSDTFEDTRPIVDEEVLSQSRSELSCNVCTCVAIHVHLFSTARCEGQMLVLFAVFLATAIGQPVSSPIDPADDIINPTNIVRAQYCLPPVVWDPALAQLADIWAKQCTYASSDPGIRDLSYFDILSNLGQNIPNPLRTGENVAAACMFLLLLVT